MPEPMKMSTSIAVFSSINIALGVVSISIQTAAIILADYVPVYIGFDSAACGIWCGIIYIIAGGFGVTASIKRTRGMLIATVVTTSLSIALAATATTVVGINADGGYYSWRCKEPKDCNLWLNLEWSLMGISAASIINNVVLVSLASVPICCSGKNYKLNPTSQFA